MSSTGRRPTSTAGSPTSTPRKPRDVSLQQPPGERCESPCRMRRPPRRLPASARGVGAARGECRESVARGGRTPRVEVMHVNDLLKIAVENGASDLHLKVGSYPMMRVRGMLERASSEKRLDHDDVVAMSAAVMSTAQRQK